MLIILAVAMVSFAGSNMKAYIIGYDQNTDFSAIKTFAYYEPLKDSIAESAPDVHLMIKYLLIIHLKDSGLEQVKENPDIYVTYHTSSSQAMRQNVTMYSYSYSMGWWWSPLWGSGMDISSYSQGNLVVDIWRPDPEELIWRAAVVGVVPDNPSPKKAQKTIEQALDKIAKEWRKVQSKAGSQVQGSGVPVP
jgi:hypothetical protein